MKNVMLLAALLGGVSVQAANYGKFRLTVNPGYYSGDKVVFLLNTSGTVKILENDNYYSVDSDFFFGDTTLEFRSAGDEDHIEGSISLKDNKAVDGCAALVDNKNGWLSFMTTKTFLLERWNKYSKKYETVYKNGFEFSEKCEEVISSNYSEFEID